MRAPLLFFAPLLFIFFPSCAYRTCQQRTIHEMNIPLFIAMPKNPEIFDNIAPQLYEALYKHFSLSGYNLVSAPCDGYELTVVIKRWTPINKFISPDVVLFHERRTLEVLYQVRDFTHKVVLEKKCKRTFLLSKPENPILNTDFVYFELDRLLPCIARQIELNIRPFLLKQFTHDDV